MDALIDSKILSAIWQDKELLQLYAYLVCQADGGGLIRINTRHISGIIKQTRYAVESNLKKLELCGAVSQKSAKNQPKICHITYYQTSELCVSVSQKSAKNQPKISQKSAKITTDAESVLKDEIASVVDLFNDKVRGTAIPQVRGLSDSRKVAVRSVAKEFGGMDAIIEAIDKVVSSDFLCGRKTDFNATFDWIFKKSNFRKIIEGNYDNKTNTSQGNGGIPQSRYAGIRDAAAAILQQPGNIDTAFYDRSGLP